MTEKLKLYIVPHTHWDREWYGSFQLFRLRLARLLNKLLDLLERDPNYRSFNLDGQTIVLEDYLEIHPEKRGQLERLISEKRLLVGPWYILPDEFLSGGEAMVRNLLLGGQIANQFGHRMNVGYIPDTFGHIAQLPQIFAGFGLENIMHFRGMDVGELPSELWWEGSDGTLILLHHLSNIIGYSDSAVLHHDPRRAAQDLRALAHYKAERATTNIVLALQGVDHTEANEGLSEIIRVANETIDDVEFIHASLEEFWAALTDATFALDLPTVRGELRDVPRSQDAMNFLLYNVLSSRADNKIDNAKTLAALEHWAEPWAAQAAAMGIADYPKGFLWTAWRWLLKNHPHDSIGGCSVDAVHRQMTTRFEWAKEIADGVTEERHRLIVEQLDLSAVDENELAVVLFNGTAWERDEIVSIDIDIPLYWLKQQAMANFHSPEPTTDDSTYRELLLERTRGEWLYGMPEMPSIEWRGLHIRPIGSNERIPIEISSCELTTQVLALASGPRGTMEVQRVRAQFRAKLPAYGYTTFALSTAPNPVKWPAPPIAPNRIESDQLIVVVHENGTFDLTNKVTNNTFRGLGLFEDGGDNGDGYMFSPPPFDSVVTTLGSAPRISHIGRGVGQQHLRIEHELRLPVSLNDARNRRRTETVICPLMVDLIVRDGVSRLEIDVTFDNRARDHRLRMLLPTDLQVETATSSMQFDAVTRPIAPTPIPVGDWWVEDPPSTFPLHGWLDVNDGERGLSVLTEGIYEFAVGQTTERPIALTLLRAVGFLGARRDLTTIIGGAGPSTQTPEAQLQQTLTWRLALYPHTWGWEDAAVWRQSAEHLTPPRVITVPPHAGSRPPTAQGISVSGENAVLSAVKQSEDGHGMIVRLYNPTNAVTTGVVRVPFEVESAETVTLQEQPLAPVWVGEDGDISIDIPPKKIVSLRLQTGAEIYRDMEEAADHLATDFLELDLTESTWINP